MNCWKNVCAVLCLASLALPVGRAAEVQIDGGDFAFVHEVAEPEGICLFPLGLRFSVESTSFTGTLVTSDGDLGIGEDSSGEASGCAFLRPVLGVAARFTGSFIWVIADDAGGNQVVTGTFRLLDFPTDSETEFDALIFIEFDGGGSALATGKDYPFGGSPQGGAAGVFVDYIVGSVEL